MPTTVVVLMLAIWAVAIAILTYVERRAAFLWVPVATAFVGVFSSLLPFAISINSALVTNGLVLLLFMLFLRVLDSKRRLSSAVVRQHNE
ncbi:MAG TPA: hypothetical protein VKW78_08025 [Terriglobales bacterium]|nr:hypothetical protein [Terriglobales bacterium]